MATKTVGVIKPVRITAAVAKRVVETVDHGLSYGLGEPIPGKMCVEAAVCYALGLGHNDDPLCVDGDLRRLKIALNDRRGWNTPKARAKGLRRLAVAQLGSTAKSYKPDLFKKLFHERSVAFFTNEIVKALKHLKIDADLVTQAAERKKAFIAKPTRHALQELMQCYYCGSNDNVGVDSLRLVGDAFHTREYLGLSLSNEFYAMGNLFDFYCDIGKSQNIQQRLLADFAEMIVQILIDIKAPGTKWLYLTE